MYSMNSAAAAHPPPDHRDVLLLLDWSDKQRRILTANGRAEDFFTAARGFPFALTDLPHHFLVQNETRSVFQAWKEEQGNNNDLQLSDSCVQCTTTGAATDTAPAADFRDVRKSRVPFVRGAWKRSLFYGGWEYSNESQERVFNLQTNTLFIDLRIPVVRQEIWKDCEELHSLDELTGEQLRYYARQHIFAGFTKRTDVAREERTQELSSGDDGAISTWKNMYCTRHHCIDWNFSGVGRNRPNRWWVQWNHLEKNNDYNQWKEWAYAEDEGGQQYYCEQWERLPDDSAGPVMSLRKCSGADGIIVIVGDHFNYCLERKLTGAEKVYPSASSPIAIVDEAVKAGDLETARAWLSTTGGHGRVSQGWKVDCAIEFWKEGTPLWKKEDISVSGDSIESCKIVWNGEEWSIFEQGVTDVMFTTVAQLRKFLHEGAL